MDTLPVLSMTHVQRMDRSLHRVALGQGLFAVSCVDAHQEETAAFGEDPCVRTRRVVREYVLDEAQIAALLAGDADPKGSSYLLFPTASLPLLGRYRHADIGAVFHKGPVEIFQNSLYAHRTTDSAHLRLQFQAIVEAHRAPFSLVSSHGTEGYTALEDRGLFYVDVATGKVVPPLLEAGYMDGGFDNSRYDLDKAAAHLLTRPDVEVFSKTLAGRRGRLADTAKDAVHNIPSYNARAQRDRSLVFLWTPKGEARARVSAWLTQNPSLWAMEFWDFVFREDLLGLRAAGAALFDDPHQTLDG